MKAIQALLLTCTLMSPMALFAGNTQAQEEMTININGEAHSFTLDTMNEGDTHTLADGAHSITVTREGDSISILRDGNPLEGKIDIHTILEDQGITLEDEAGTMVKKAIFISSDGDGTDIDIDIEALGDELNWEGSAEGEAHKIVLIKESNVESEDGEGVTVEKEVKVIVIKHEDD